MNEYVALFVGYDHCLGPTIKCSTWDQAVKTCQELADDHYDILTGEQITKLKEDGEVIFADGGGVYIGELETPD